VRKGPGFGFPPGVSVDFGNNGSDAGAYPFVLGLVPHLFMGGKLPWLKQHLDSSGVPVEVATDVLMQNHVVVCGYGQVGRNLGDWCRSMGYLLW